MQQLIIAASFIFGDILKRREWLTINALNSNYLSYMLIQFLITYYVQRFLVVWSPIYLG